MFDLSITDTEIKTIGRNYIHLPDLSKIKKIIMLTTVYWKKKSHLFRTGRKHLLEGDQTLCIKTLKYIQILHPDTVTSGKALRTYLDTALQSPPECCRPVDWRESQKPPPLHRWLRTHLCLGCSVMWTKETRLGDDPVTEAFLVLSALVWDKCPTSAIPQTL